MKNQWRVIVGFILVLVIVIFAVMNTDSTTVHFIFTSQPIPLVFVILGSAFIGAIIVFTTSFSTIHNQKKIITQLNKEVKLFTEDMDSKVEEKYGADKKALEAEKKAAIATADNKIKEQEQEIILLRQKVVQNSDSPVDGTPIVTEEDATTKKSN